MNSFALTGTALPALLSFEAEHQKMQVLTTENHHLHNRLADARQAQAEAGMSCVCVCVVEYTAVSHWNVCVCTLVHWPESTVQKLEARLAQQVASQASTTASSVTSKRKWGKKMSDFMKCSFYFSKLITFKVVSQTVDVSNCIHVYVFRNRPGCFWGKRRRCTVCVYDHTCTCKREVCVCVCVCGVGSPGPVAERRTSCRVRPPLRLGGPRRRWLHQAPQATLPVALRGRGKSGLLLELDT